MQSPWYVTGAVTVSVLMALAPGGLQTPSVAGTWTGTSDGNTRRNADGSLDVLSRIEFRMSLTVSGERVSGEWSGRQGEASRRWPLSGSWSGGQLDLASDWQTIEVTSNGEPRSLEARWIIRGMFEGDQLEGTRHLEIRGQSREPVRLRWQARRSAAPESVERVSD